ncbi:hypothetical protein [Natronomonas sp. EA1]|uniref:hypothetical protein n=1 Tax=Natronomonas sp. EA1 TaxID=3421655 RepID=UPI003EB8B81F
MAELFIFTIFATIIAIYSVLPPYRQLRIGYSLYKRGILALTCVFLLLTVATYIANLYLQHREVESLGGYPTPYLVVNLDPLAINLIQLVSVSAIFAMFVTTIMKSNVRIRNEEYLLSTLRGLYNRSEFATLVEVIGDNYKPLIDHPTKPQPPAAFGNASIAEILSEEDDPYPNREVHKIEGVDRFTAGASDWLKNHLPERWVERFREPYNRTTKQLNYRWRLLRYHAQETAEDASDYTETLLLDPVFRQEHPLIDPYFGIDIISDQDINFPREKFIEGYLSTMLRAENSLLYRNVSDNMSLDGMYRYHIDPDNQLIHALFSDCEVAKNLNVYRPIGETTKTILREQAGKDHDQYNGRQFTDSEFIGNSESEESETHVFSDPLYVAIMFFDIMIRESFAQEMKWHMWLYYYESFTRQICDNYELTDEADRAAEWPNDYSRLLYEMTSNMREWLNLLEHMILEDDGELKTVNDDGEEVYKDFIRLDEDNIDDDRARENLPKAAVICLISCLKSIVLADEIPMQFKEYITEQIFITGVELSQHGDDSLPNRYSQLMLANLRANIEDRRKGAEFQSELRRVYSGDVRHEVRVQAMTGGGIHDELDDIIL